MVVVVVFAVGLVTLMFVVAAVAVVAVVAVVAIRAVINEDYAECKRRIFERRFPWVEEPGRSRELWSQLIQIIKMR